MTPTQLLQTITGDMTSGGYSWEYYTSPLDEFNEEADEIEPTGAFVYFQRPATGQTTIKLNRVDTVFFIRLKIATPSNLAQHQSEREANMQKMYGGMYELIQRLEQSEEVEELRDIQHNEVYNDLDLNADGLEITFKLKMQDVAVCPA